ncbi:alpha-L-rhamnosidase C-terminal domain-containing protein, partial [Kineococcus glutinatus]|uniref:alpha-L-rhamnosidase-related protein n=1 Tax=Kineococcus glutinatus TaxID=1070872 RepID=UPI0031EDBB16
ALRWVEHAASRAAAARHPVRAARRTVPAPHERFLWDTGFHFGEWLEPGVPPRPDPGADHGIVATAYLHRSALLVARAARVLGRPDVDERCSAIAAGAREAWRREYLGEDGRLTEESQANYVRALAFDLVPARLRPATAGRLVELVRAAGTHLGTGFLATGMLLPVLADTGHGDVAYELLLDEGDPSWLGMLAAGATTVWEWWDGISADGTARGSLNHYSKGAVASFLHTHVAGLRLPAFPGPDEAGYRRVRIAPVPTSRLTAAHTRQDTRAGRFEVSWSTAGGTFVLEAVLPPGTAADVELPDGTTCRVGGGTHRFRCAAPG